MQEQTPFLPTRAAQITALLVIFIFGMAIRFYDLTDLPLDFHSTRQMLSAIKARGMYYQTQTDFPSWQRAFAVQQWKYRAAVEPEFIERVVAFTYQLTGERLWIARIYSSAFWVIGGIFLFLLARRLASMEGALAAAAFYLFLPYAVIASRSFQPDPLMTMLIVIFWWAVYRWSENRASYKWAVVAGLFGGFAIYVKFVAAFFVIAGGLGALLGRGSLREALKQPQVYVMSVLGILPGAAYFIYGVWIAGYLGQQFSGRFVPAFLLNPSYYLGWLNMLNLVVGGMALALGLIGLFFFEKEKRRFLFGLWAGYFLFGIYFNFHISSHDYYSLPLIPILALSLIPLAELFFSKLAQVTPTRVSRIPAYCVLFLGLFAVLWNSRNQLNAVDYRPEAAMWAEISQKAEGYNLAGLTQDYGSRLAYWGWRSITSWPTYGDLYYRGSLRGGQYEFDELFFAIVQKRPLFLVTDFRELNRQPLLKERLKEYPVFAEGDGYVIYFIER
jgi:4-amino-4-deoxy-L-arabinose transferase-like glycosyltransferase